MSLRVNTEKVETLKKSRRGKNSKVKGAQYERLIAKKFEERYGLKLVRTPQSGGFAKSKTENNDRFRGDIVPLDKEVNLKFHIECKNHKKWNLPEWIDQAKNDCPKEKIPIIIFKRFNSSENYVTMSLEDFFNLVSSITEAE